MLSSTHYVAQVLCILRSPLCRPDEGKGDLTVVRVARAESSWVVYFKATGVPHSMLLRKGTQLPQSTLSLDETVLELW